VRKIRDVASRSTRASDEDREHVARVLRRHAVAGRLTMEELEERIGAAFGARTLRELDALQSDLPRDRRQTTVPALLLHGAVLLLIGVLVVTIAILLALAWATSRLVAAVVARSLEAHRVRALRTGL
jgi:hypothetical protein